MAPDTVPAGPPDFTVRAVLWDMDGTLVDSGDLHFAAWRESMLALGRDLTRAEFDATFGQRNDAILRRLVEQAIDAAEIARGSAAGRPRNKFTSIADMLTAAASAPKPTVRERILASIR